MHVNLHKNALTTPAIRRRLLEATLPVAELARRYNLGKAKVRKWRQWEDSADHSHRPRTTLSPAHEAIKVACARRCPWMDDRLAVRGSVNV